MYPGTIFEFIDQSDIALLPLEQPIYKPMYMTGITSDKGPEEYRVVEGDLFFKLYGNKISFAKHGQPLLQAAAIINAGGRLFVKRIVDPASTLANLAVLAKVSKIEVQKTNANGIALYIDDVTGAETTEATSSGGAANAPVMIDKCKIKYETQTVEDSKDLDTIAATILGSSTNLPSGSEGTYPLFVISDNGRGISNKNFQITPDYASSKAVDYVRYMFNVMESNSTIESVQFSVDPDTLDNGVNVSLQSRIKRNSNQVKCVHFEEYLSKFIDAVGTISGIGIEEYAGMDILFGKSKKGEAVSTVEIDSTGINLSHPYGLRLTSGDDGTFTDKVYATDIYEDEMVKVFNGDFGSEIYDLDNYKIDLIVDANYPAAVKRSIEGLVSFREDCFYIRDLGLYLDSMELIEASDRNSLKNKFCASYCNSYDIVDPYSKKQISVTVSYTLAKLLVPHFINGRNRPLAGQLHGMILSEAIEGTINFLPVITPSVNQKDELGDLRINYASYYDNVLVLETTYTAQEKHTQFTYSNNVLAIQEVTKAIRSRCPKIRYSFIDGEDLEKYKADVQSVIDKYVNNFLTITLEYIADPVYISNKVFYAALKVQFRNFVQTEYFKVIALPS